MVGVKAPHVGVTPIARRTRIAGRSGIYALTVCAALLVLSAVLAPAAGAVPRGILGYYDFSASSNPAAGGVSNPSGLAVNTGGTGGASPGDVYLLSGGAPGPIVGNFKLPATDGGITQVDATGAFRRVWGRDVVAKGPGQSVETQRIIVDATAGTFTLTMHNIVASGTGGFAAGETKLSHLQPKEGGGEFEAGQRIEADGLFDGTTIEEIGLEHTLKLSRQALASAPSGTGFSELEIARNGSTSLVATDGTGSTTGNLPYNATAAEVQSALNALPQISAGGGSVSVSGGPGGSSATPYLVKFDGGPLAGVDQPLLVAASGSTPLSGGGASTDVQTINPGAVGFEICDKAAGDVCKQSAAQLDDHRDPYMSLGGTLPSNSQLTASRLAMDRASGDLYAIGNGRVTRYSATGQFISAWGDDAVASGPDDSSANEQQKVKVVGDGGSFTLSYNPCLTFFCPAEAQKVTTAPIPYNASPGTVKAALDAALASAPRVEGFAYTGKVTVTGGPGDATGSNPYFITFSGGGLAGDDVGQMTSSTSLLTLSVPGAKAAEVTTVSDGGDLENCKPIDACNFRGRDTTGQGFETYESGTGLTVAPAGAPNAGNVLLGDYFSSRIMEYTKEGVFVRAFGWDVDATNPSTGFEVCPAADQCKKGTIGSGLGQFVGTGNAKIAVAPGGAIYVLEAPSPNSEEASTTARLQKFTPAGGLNLTPSLFGSNEVQTATVNATAGQFRLGFVDPKGTAGTTSGPIFGDTRTLADVHTTKGAFEVGQILWVGSFIPEGIKIVAIGPETITLAKPVGFVGSAEIFSPRHIFTGDLPATASAAEVQTALNSLGPISADGNSVSVTGGPGDAGGNNPYSITFDGGHFQHADVPQMAAQPGTTPLSGGSGAGANTASIATLSGGGPLGQNVRNLPHDITVGAGENLLIAKRYEVGNSRCEDGSFTPFEVRVQELSPSGSVIDTTKPCTALAATGSTSLVDADPVNGTPYLYNSRSGSRVYLFGDQGPAPQISMNPVSGESPTGAVISGTINPNGPLTSFPNPATTTYKVEYKKPSESSWTLFAPDAPVGHNATPNPFSIGVSGLDPNTAYEVRVVVTKPYDAGVVSATQSFSTQPAAPEIEAFSSSDVTASSADLHALINPLGTETSYHFEYGTTPEYGHSTPEVGIGSGFGAVAVQAHISDLDPVVYHFRVVAHNSVGTTTTTDQTFTFYPQSCPNAAVRQQTGSDALPDCRAYELVSPANAGGSQLMPGGPSSSGASTPSRLGYLGAVSAIPGPWNPPSTLGGDQYLATRTSEGWKTAYVGLPADVGRAGGSPTRFTGRSMSDLSLDRFLHWRYDAGPSNTPYTINASGTIEGRLPTNMEEVPGADTPQFKGDGLLSADGKHYFFSSESIAFAPGGLTTGAGSVYDNNLVTGAVTVISKLSDGSPILRDSEDHSNSFMRIPSVSQDNSHILIAVGPVPHLYMRLPAAGTTYDVSKGYTVSYQGTTGDGSKVYFTSGQQITSDDHDESVDLYMWSQATDAITRISAGVGLVGDVDTCGPTWTAKCNVEVVPSDGGGSVFPGGQGDGMATDNSIASKSGDIYFYSPEQLVGPSGIPGRRNLYVYHGGQLHYVTTLEDGKQLIRIQVAPNGVHAAFITKTPLTSYENAGHSEMYSFNADSGKLLCVSCIPDGSPPTGDVIGSMGGLFMTDDGRTFFWTEDALVPQDSNNGFDSYEYVEGRPQLISSGAGETGFTGFVGVSGDGVDAYFTTVDTLVSEDLNGGAVRFYDARTGGGFPHLAPAIPCAAADECHGVGSGEPAAPSLGSTAGLGDTGNARETAHKKHKHKKHKHKKRHGHTKGKRHNGRVGG